ncbi:hypothetical protein QOZ80_3BG0294160 [Eleusine coracana subsp. coracana]|nr:hypothetical protein QOZ80_3BG0294160 [Eleusine coracana subsp. coracana]
MRIRRYAARLLSSSTDNPGSPPPQPAAAWLHDAADDCCAFCDLVHTSPQDSPDSVKHKGHIAGRVPESDVKSGEGVELAQGLPAPQAKRCKIDHDPPFNEADTNGGSVLNEAAVKLEDARGATHVTKDDVNPAFKAGPLVANDAIIELEVKCGDSLMTDAAKPNVTGGNSLVNGSTSELEVSLLNEEAFDPEVTERVSLESSAVTLPGVTGRQSDVTGQVSITNESGELLGIRRTDSLVNEASTEPELMDGVSRTTKTATDAGVTITVPEVTRTGSLRNEGVLGPEVTGVASLVQEAAELEATEDPIPSQTAWEPEDTCRVSCSVDDDPASCEAQPPNFNTRGNVQRNAGETVVIAMQPSRCDAADGDGSVSSTCSSPVGGKDPTVERGVAHDRSVTPSVSCILDIVARSIGTSGRTDVICYARRKGKKKLDLLEVKMETIELDDGVICDQIEEDETLDSNGPCEHVTSGAGYADVKLADIKRELMDNSTARMVKKMKTNRFECDIDYCRMTFRTKTELSVHKKNMCTVKSCSRHFRSHKYLRRHQSVHNDYMPYRCPWEGCGMAFKCSWDRTEHFQVHAGVKPYKCTTPGCSKIYKFVSDFSRHRRWCKPQEIKDCLVIFQKWSWDQAAHFQVHATVKRYAHLVAARYISFFGLLLAQEKLQTSESG